MSLDRPLVSAVIPTRNRADYLRQAIESVLGQSYSAIEVIVIDHASTDDTHQVLAQFSDRVRTISLGETGLGLPAIPRNSGLHEARGALIAFLDDDDIWEHRKIEEQVELISAQRDCALVCSDALLIKEDGEPTGKTYLRHTSGVSGRVFSRLVDDNFVITSSVLARTELVLELGGFDERPEMAKAEDYHLWLRLAARHAIGFISDPLVRFRRHSSSHSKSSSIEALRQRRTVLRSLKRELPGGGAAWDLRLGIAKDYARSIISMFRGTS